MSSQNLPTPPQNLLLHLLCLQLLLLDLDKLIQILQLLMLFLGDVLVDGGSCRAWDFAGDWRFFGARGRGGRLDWL